MVLAILCAASRCDNRRGITDGQNVQGTAKWFKVSWNATTGYYSSVADDVPLAKQADIEGNYDIQRCGTGADINQTPAGDAPLTVLPEERSYEAYNRGAATQWALNNAQAIRANPFADCTWFVSQALWAGGLDQTSYWNNYNGRQGKYITTPGTVTATSAPELVRYLQKRFVVIYKGYTLKGIPYIEVFTYYHPKTLEADKDSPDVHMSILLRAKHPLV